MDQTAARGSEISFARLITTCISARLLVDIGVQMFNPFLPIFAAGLKTDVVKLGRVMSLRTLMGMFSLPVIGEMADRLGYRLILRSALIVSAVGMWLVGASTNVWMALPGLILIGLGLAGFVPTLQAYLSARLPYSRRARGMGMLEYSWALTGIVGLSLIGLLIEYAGWRTPFFLLGAGMVVMSFVFARLPGVSEENHARGTGESAVQLTPWQRLTGFFQVAENAGSTYAAIAACSLTFYAGMQFMVVHGAWFAAEYGFHARQLGMVALIFGFADLGGSVSVSLFTDRFGKRRSVLLGNAVSMLGYILIPFFNTGAMSAVISAAITRGFFEFAIVANFPLLSEQSPAQRAKVMTLNAASSFMVASAANFFAPSIYVNIGIGGVAAISAVCALCALLILTWRVREGGLQDAGS